MRYQLFTNTPFEPATKPVGGYPLTHNVPEGGTVPEPEDHVYVLLEDRPTEFDTNTQKVVRDDPTPQGWGWSIVDLSDAEIEERVNQKAIQTEAQAEQRAEEIVSKEKLAEERTRIAALPDGEAMGEIELFPPFEIGKLYDVGERFQFEGQAYKANIQFTGATHQLPGMAGLDALFTRIPFPGEVLPWEQPSGAQDAYQTGDQVSYEGQTWESTVDANVFAPGVVAGQWVVVP